MAYDSLHSVQVIGLGWPRTGTGTLCKALTILGFGPCYHMSELLQSGEAGWRPWLAASKTTNQTHRAELVLEALRGYRSAADVPVAAFWKEILHAQDAGLVSSSMRYVLPDRSASEWYASAEATVLAGWRNPGSANSPHAKNMADVVWTRLFGSPRLLLPRDREKAMSAYDEHQLSVAAQIREDILIRWRVEDGWSGLCGQLQLAEPSEVLFPWRNQRDGTDAFVGATVVHMDWFSFRGAIVVLNVFLPVFVLGACCYKPHDDSPNDLQAKED